MLEAEQLGPFHHDVLANKAIGAKDISLNNEHQLSLETSSIDAKLHLPVPVE